MKKSLIVYVAAAITASLAVALASPGEANAAWCWPSCSSSGYLGSGTSTYNGCWRSSGEVCSGWNYWTSNGISKGCYPRCSYGNYTQARILYGFENASTIRGWYTDIAETRYVYAYQLSMGGYLRAQASWATYTDGRVSYTSYVHVGAV